MKNIILFILFGLFFNGCSIIDDFEMRNAKKQFAKLCINEDLFICKSKGKDILDKDLTYLSIEYDSLEFFKVNGTVEIIDLSFYTLDEFSKGKYKYTYDKSDNYKYMFPNKNNIKKGDCEDYAITFIEDNILNGNIQKGQVKMIFGKAGNVYHSWVLFKRDGVEYIFDTYHLFGISKEKALEERSYRKVGVLYSY